jgi:hypothetical protein
MSLTLTLELSLFLLQSKLFVFPIHSSATSKLLLNLNIQICYILSTLFGEIPLGIVGALRHIIEASRNCRVTFRTQLHVNAQVEGGDRDGILFSFCF